jgi:hypothetical protein
MITHAHMLPAQHRTPCVVLAGVFWVTPVWLSRVSAIEEDSEWQAVQFRWGGPLGNGTVVHPATIVLLCGGYNETCAALGEVPKQWWLVPVACRVLPSVCCPCGVVVVVKYILYTFLDPCLCFTWTPLISFSSCSSMSASFLIMKYSLYLVCFHHWFYPHAFFNSACLPIFLCATFNSLQVPHLYWLYPVYVFSFNCPRFSAI